MDKQRFPLTLMPAPQGWHLTIAEANGQTNRLLKPATRNESNIPYLFASQQEAWSFIKEHFSLILKNGKSDGQSLEQMRTCKRCDRIFRGRAQDYCAQCMKDNEFILEQLWVGFQIEAEPGFTVKQKVAVLVNLNEDSFLHIPEQYKTLVQQPILLEEAQENEAPSPARQLSRIIRSRANAPRRRHAH